MEAIAVNVYDGVILLDTNETVFIETMLDFEGDETLNHEEAMAAIAPLPNGQWIAVDLTQFERQATQ